MARKRMYRKGEKLSVMQAVRCILRGQYIIMGDKPMHPSWMRGMTLSAIYYQVCHGRLFAAERNEE